MNKEKIGHIEKLLGRELSEEEQERLARIQDILGIADNDALWDILIALEYQRAFYETLPKKISGASGAILAQLSAAADKEIAHAQSRCRNQCLDLVIEQRLFQLLSAVACFTGVGLYVEALGLQPFGDLVGVAYRQRVDDSVALQRGELLRQPCKAFGLAGQADGLQRE